MFDARVDYCYRVYGITKAKGGYTAPGVKGRYIVGTVSISKGSKVVRAVTFELAEYLEKNFLDYRDGMFCGDSGDGIGTWIDPDTGDCDVDRVRGFDDRAEAIAVATIYNQKAIYDTLTGEPIAVDTNNDPLAAL